MSLPPSLTTLMERIARWHTLRRRMLRRLRAIPPRAVDSREIGLTVPAIGFER